MEATGNTVSTFGLNAEFRDESAILAAATQAYAAGYRKMEAYTPLPVHGLSEAIGFKENLVPWIIFIGGALGCLGGFGLQYYVSAVDYPLNVGGRPYNSWPSFIPVTFECTVLLASLAAFVGMLALNGLPRPHHPIFGARRIELATQDRFFLCIEATDPLFERDKTTDFLRGIGADTVTEVEVEE